MALVTKGWLKQRKFEEFCHCPSVLGFKNILFWQNIIWGRNSHEAISINMIIVSTPE